MHKLLLAATLLLASGADQSLFAQDDARVFAGTGERKCTRVLYWGQSGPEGQIAISWGPVAWKDSYSEHIAKKEFLGRRWRLGKDFWTTLDTQLPLTVAGKKIGVGLHYLTAVKTKDGDFELHVLDPSEVRKLKLDPFVADKAKQATAIPMSHKTTEDSAKSLKISLGRKEGQKNELQLRVAFGPHHLSAPVEVHRD